MSTLRHIAIVPAILPHSRAELEEALARLAPLGHHHPVQVDVVDGRFATPASWPYTEGDSIPEAIPALAMRCFDADLMVEEPEEVVGAWLDAGASRVTLHLETLRDPERTIALLKDRYGHETGGPCAFELGLAANMATGLELLVPHIPHIDYLQLMGIDTIGRQGEPFDEGVLDRIRTLRARYPALTIQIDGGVTLETAPALLASGADRLIVGHAILKAVDPSQAFSRFETLLAAPPPERARYTGGMPLTDTDIEALAQMAGEIRQTVIEMLTAAGSGHTAGPLGMADIFAALYFHILVHDPRYPEWEERDRLVLSNGHITPVRYAAMAHAGYFPVEECMTLRKFGTRLQGHPERLRLPGLETTSGPLGEGLSQASGMAYALRLDKKSNRVYCLMSDGEQQEGNTWEAALFAGKNKLHNLTAVMDRNNIQIDGMTEDVMPLEPLADKYRAFGWHVIETNGNDIAAFIMAVEEAKAVYEKPTIIIAHTIPGKGVKEIEFDYRWHGVPPGAGPEDVWPKNEQAAAMLRELRTLHGTIEHE